MLSAALLAAVTVAAPPLPDVWYGPNPFSPSPGKLREDFFSNVTAPGSQWPHLAADTQAFKTFIGLLAGPLSKQGTPIGSTDAELRALIAVIKERGMRTTLEIGGARWNNGRCDLDAQLAYAAMEQGKVGRWIKLGGVIDSIATDHANTWDVRPGSKAGVSCVPAVPMTTRIDAVAQVYASWRRFLGPQASIGFIESLGYWEIEGPDGTRFNSTAQAQLDKIAGWVPRLDDVTAMILAAAAKYNPTPATPLLDHYIIDFGMSGVEFDTQHYGTAGPTGVNYNRVLGAEAIMHRHGLQSGVFLNAFHDKKAIANCTLTPGCSESAASLTINYTRGYMQQPQRLSEYMVLEQWQPYPNVTGPETVQNTGMWMARQCAAVIKGEAGPR